MEIQVSRQKLEVTIITEKGRSKIHKFGKTFKCESDVHNRHDLRVIGNYLEKTSYFQKGDLKDANYVQAYITENINTLDKVVLRCQFNNGVYLVTLHNRGIVTKTYFSKDVNEIYRQSWIPKFDRQRWKEKSFKIIIK